MNGAKKLIFLFLLLAGGAATPFSLSAQEYFISPPRMGPFKSIEFFLGEEARYDISFLWFKQAASGHFNFTREGEGFRATLHAETKGFIGYLTDYRKHHYVSHMTYLPGEGRFRVHLFERLVIRGDRREETITTLDYKRRTLLSRLYIDGVVTEVREETIPEDVVYEDILSAFYNVRHGAYGPLDTGRRFQLRTIPHEGQSLIDVEILTEAGAAGQKRLFEGERSDTLLNVNVRVPREIFKSKTGEVAVLFNDAIIPVQGVVKDYIGFGDVRCVLLDRSEPAPAPSVEPLKSGI